MSDLPLGVYMCSVGTSLKPMEPKLVPLILTGESTGGRPELRVIHEYQSIRLGPERVTIETREPVPLTARPDKWLSEQEVSK